MRQTFAQSGHPGPGASAVSEEEYIPTILDALAYFTASAVAINLAIVRLASDR
jgi:hypothetical protein